MTVAPDRTTDPLVTADQLGARIIEPSQFVPDTEAFVDVRLPRSAGKASYSFIGPGVSQNAGQTVNIREPHGFNVGGASMPHGTVNNQHLHFTAEVFVCTRGTFRVWAGEHADQSLDIAAGDIISVPTWLYRGFENTGPDDGFLFAVLGGDVTGGIIWAPWVLERAADTGLYLGADLTVRDATAGDSIDDLIQPLADEHRSHLRVLPDEALAARCIARSAVDWSDRSLLSSALDGHASAVAPVIGHGVSEHRDHHAPLIDAHGFGIEWLRLAPGSSTGAHLIDASQVLLVTDGLWEIACNRGEARVSARPATGSVVSLPTGAWRDFVNVGGDDAYACVITQGDGPNPVEWAPEIVGAAAAAGWALDAGGHLAPAQAVGGQP